LINYKITIDLLGSIQDQNVKFEIRVPNYTYIGVGNAENEEMARKKALEDIVLYLARQNEIPNIPKVLKIIVLYLLSLFCFYLLIFIYLIRKKIK